MSILACDRRPGCQVDICKCEFGSDERNATSSSLDLGEGGPEGGDGGGET